jgi:hypothetical protein
METLQSLDKSRFDPTMGRIWISVSLTGRLKVFGGTENLCSSNLVVKVNQVIIFDP